MKQTYRSLTLPDAIATRVDKIAKQLTPVSSLGGLITHILEDVCKYIEAEGDHLPPLSFIDQVRARLGKYSAGEFATAAGKSIEHLEKRIAALEKALQTPVQPTIYRAESEHAPRAAEVSTKPKQPKRTR